MSRASAALLDALPGLRAHVAQVPAVAEIAPARSVLPSAARAAQNRLDILRPALATRAGSRERAATLREIAAAPQVYKGKAKRIHEKTLRDWLSAYQRRGLAGLLPKPNSKSGARRVLVTRQWDNGIDLDDAGRARVAAQLDRYVKSLIAKDASGRLAAKLAKQKLAELSMEAGSTLPKAKLERLCALSHRYVGRFAEWKRVARHDKDHKAFFDRDLPRVSRARCAWPLEVVWGDVHFVDITAQDNLRIRCIAWLDDGTRYSWCTFAILGKGQGIRQTDVADALFHLVTDPVGGLPTTFNLDNGGEYGAVARAMLEIPDATSIMEQYRSVVLSQPYNGPAKGGIERHFRTLEEGYFKHIPGWIGGDRTNKKTHAIGKPVKPFPGTELDLVQALQSMVDAYNSAPDSALNGQSPREAMQAAIDRGWRPARMDEEAFDFAFSRREERTITQGRFQYDNDLWCCDATDRLGRGTKVELRIPLRSDASGIFVLCEGVRLPGRAMPVERYHAIDRDGAREKTRRGRAQLAQVRELKAEVDRKVDVGVEMLRQHATRTPLEVEAKTITRLAPVEEAETTPFLLPDDKKRKLRDLYPAPKRMQGGA